jgi:hypothetical protein
MPKIWRTLIWLSLVGAICLTVAIVFAKTDSTTPLQTGSRVTRPNGRPRTMRLQPQAAKLAQLLGKRFAAEKKLRSVLAGSLTIDGITRQISITRQQLDDGEQVNIHLSGSPAPLTWSAETAAIANGARAVGVERELIERLVFDSPDQFVLAQLRGASYFTVAHQARQPEATDAYDGPLWDVIRVDDSPSDETKRPESSWRLYYVNLQTGLIDRVMYELRGEPVQAEFLNWTDYEGERVPSHIVWRKGTTAIMEFQLTSFSQAETASNE